jgi:integrase
VEPGKGFEPMCSESAASKIAQTIENIGKVVSEFQEYCVVDERLAHVVGKDYKNIARRFLEHTKGVISRESIRSYLNTYINKSPKTYNNQLDGLRAFIIRFMNQPALMNGFKKAHVDYYDYDTELPTKEQLQTGFNALNDDRERAIFLLYATTGLRKTELWKLTFSEIDFDSRCIRSRHNTRIKKAGITFYNEEAETYLKRYLQTRKDDKPRLIRIDSTSFANIWKRASQAAGCYIRPQILRKWHSTMLGELGVPDRYVDIFQGRAPRTVLAKHYTGKGFNQLRRINKNAMLQALAAS